jgi:hypothetical protein
MTPSSGMWRRVGLVRTDVSEERAASWQQDTVSRLLTLFFPRGSSTLKMEAIRFSGSYKTHTVLHPRTRQSSWLSLNFVLEVVASPLRCSLLFERDHRMIGFTESRAGATTDS